MGKADATFPKQDIAAEIKTSEGKIDTFEKNFVKAADQLRENRPDAREKIVYIIIRQGTVETGFSREAAIAAAQRLMTIYSTRYKFEITEVWVEYPGISTPIVIKKGN